ncbi:MAG TPA: pyridoxamine 5'-phosphate oxidase [Stellaceae bacterium]|nr:pyridoxamine 5'-phosphate oxidase [Stellaceae bacterium]
MKVAESGFDMTDDITENEPFLPFARWFALAAEREALAETMMLATVGPGGRPSVRAVLLKGADARGFVFYTNLESRKAGELAANPHVALAFHWKSLARQVRVEGDAAPVTDQEADAYFATRPRESRIGAWASDQSRPLDSRATLERRFAEAERRYDGREVPRPADWSGFRIVPQLVEFWQERPHRLHDRIVFTRDGEGWRKQRLFP